MTFEEYRQYDALGLAGLIRKKEVTAGELVEVAEIDDLGRLVHIFARHG